MQPKKKGGRPRTGSVTKHEDSSPAGFHYDVRITLTTGKRGNRRCLESGTSYARAQEIAAAMTERASQVLAPATKSPAPVPPPPAGPPAEPWAGWCSRWLEAREARKPGSTKENKGHFNNWVPEALRAKPMREVTTEDLEGVVEALDGAVSDDTITWKTAVNAWGTITKMFVDASRGKRRALRVLKSNPCLGVTGPDRGADKAKVYLYPAEFVALMACSRIPTRWRRLFALSIYLYPRPGELEALHLEDIDLQHRVIFIHRAIDRTGEEKETKTGLSRRIPIEPDILSLLDRMIVEAREEGAAHLLRMPPECDLSARLRQYLRWAGVTRAELFAEVEDRTRKRVTFYDLRATGITWQALRGDEPLKIQQRAGHTEFKTTQGYIRAAEELRHAIKPSDVFPPLPEEVVLPSILSSGASVFANLRESQWDPERPQRDSNPRKRPEFRTGRVGTAEHTRQASSAKRVASTGKSAEDGPRPKPEAETSGPRGPVWEGNVAAARDVIANAPHGNEASVFGLWLDDLEDGASMAFTAPGGDA